MAHDHTRKIVLNALVVILRGVADLKTLAWCEHLTILIDLDLLDLVLIMDVMVVIGQFTNDLSI